MFGNLEECGKPKNSFQKSQFIVGGGGNPQIYHSFLIWWASITFVVGVLSINYGFLRPLIVSCIGSCKKQMNFQQIIRFLINYIRKSRNYTIFLESTHSRDRSGLMVHIKQIEFPGICSDITDLYNKCGDIALLKLEREVIEVYSDDHPNINTVCLPKQNSEPSNKTLKYIGWGRTEKKEPSDILKMATTELKSMKYCTSMSLFNNIGMVSEITTDNKLCVQAVDNQACYV